MIILMLALGAAAFGAGMHIDLRRQEKVIRIMRAELEALRDPELLRAAELRKQMGQEQRAFNLLCNYGTELAYGQVSAADMLGKEGQV